jgi:hypothetical protein
MAKLAGLVSVVSELKAERTNLANQLSHIGQALSVSRRKLGGIRYGQPRTAKRIRQNPNAQCRQPPAGRSLLLSVQGGQK